MWREYEQRVKIEVNGGDDFFKSSEKAIDEYLEQLKVLFEQMAYTVYRLQTDPPPPNDTDTWTNVTEKLPDTLDTMQKEYDTIYKDWKSWEQIRKIACRDTNENVFYWQNIHKTRTQCKKLDSRMKRLMQLNGEAIFALHYAAFQNFSA